jgi:Predicted membrane protein
MTKTITFAIMHFSVAFGVTYALTGDIVVGSAVALVEPAVNTVGYHVHERVWERIRRYRAARNGRARRTPMPLAA